jgi:hypothetical protein
MAKKTKTTPPSPPRSERSAFRAMLEAELIGRKEARRAAPDYNPAMILMSPFEDARLVLAQYRREHPELGDYELIEYAIVEPRPELCTPASRAAAEAWRAEMRAKEAAQQGAERYRREGPVNELIEPSHAEQARREEPIAAPTPPAVAPEPAPQPAPRNTGAPSEPWLGPHGWMNR